MVCVCVGGGVCVCMTEREREVGVDKRVKSICVEMVEECVSSSVLVQLPRIQGRAN